MSSLFDRTVQGKHRVDVDRDHRKGWFADTVQLQAARHGTPLVLEIDANPSQHRAEPGEREVHAPLDEMVGVLVA